MAVPIQSDMSGRQTELTFRTWGGKRTGAGRKPAEGRRRMPHGRRERVNARHPLLITTRVVPEVGRLRSRAARAAVRDALAVASKHMYADEAFRICHASIQRDHLHLIAEADSNEAMARGMKGFLVSCARRINAALGRGGTVFPDRYHASSLGSPTQVRNALSYVLCNWRKHDEVRAGVRLDPCSSAFARADWSPGPIVLREVPLLLPVALPRTWLLATGWRRAGSISPWTRPGPA
jgi:REP element-mobilizing transposase RayT